MAEAAWTEESKSSKDGELWELPKEMDFIKQSIGGKFKAKVTLKTKKFSLMKSKTQKHKPLSSPERIKKGGNNELAWG